MLQANHFHGHHCLTIRMASVSITIDLVIDSQFHEDRDLHMLIHVERSWFRHPLEEHSICDCLPHQVAYFSLFFFRNFLCNFWLLCLHFCLKPTKGISGFFFFFFFFGFVFGVHLICYFLHYLVRFKSISLQTSAVNGRGGDRCGDNEGR